MMIMHYNPQDMSLESLKKEVELLENQIRKDEEMAMFADGPAYNQDKDRIREKRNRKARLSSEIARREETQSC